MALLLVIIDSTTHWLKPARHYLSELTYPIHWLADLPGRMSDWGEDATQSREDLERERDQLRTQLLVMQGQQQTMAQMAAERRQLRSLLNATEMVRDHQVRVAELIGLSPDPLKHKIMINRGSSEGVFVGQAVIGGEGLMGQVTEVFHGHSWVLLITDSSHSFQVQVTRNNLRALAEGTGDYGRLKLLYVSPTMNIREGDQLVSSGLGGLYPVGYPVGTVTKVQQLPGEPFMDIEVSPLEPLSRRRQVLLLFSPREEGKSPSEEQEATSQSGPSESNNISGGSEP